MLDKQFVLFGDNSPWVSCISGCSISRGTDFLLDYFFQWYLYNKELWNVQMASSPRATSRHALLLPVTESLGFPGGSDGKESTCNEGDLGSIPGWEDPLEEVMGTRSSILPWRIPMDREAWWTTVPGIAKSQTQLSAMQAHTHLCVHTRTHTQARVHC